MAIGRYTPIHARRTNCPLCLWEEGRNRGLIATGIEEGSRVPLTIHQERIIIWHGGAATRLVQGSSSVTTSARKPCTWPIDRWIYRLIRFVPLSCYVSNRLASPLFHDQSFSINHCTLCQYVVFAIPLLRPSFATQALLLIFASSIPSSLSSS